MATTNMQIRLATKEDYAEVERLAIDSFEPVTWAVPLEQRFGKLNGLDWRARWALRLQKLFAEQTVLIGIADGAMAAISSSTIDQAALGYIDILAVARGRHGRGYGREMLRATVHSLQERGARYVNLDCLTTNENANRLYESEGFVEVARHIRWFRKL